MGLANFFDKAALSVSQVLQGLDHVALAAMLQESAVGVAFDDEASATAEGRAALELAINLLARLYPNLALAPAGSAADGLAVRLTGIAHAINPDIAIGSDLAAASVIAATGSTPVAAARPVVCFGSTGWVARLSSEGPTGSGSTANPFGAGAAACLAVANVFRLLFAKHLPGGALDGSLALSLLDYLPNEPEPADPPLGPVDLGESFLVGVGAIGNASVWALARTPGLHGTLHLIDSEAVDITNLQRYVLTTQKDLSAAKVELARRSLARTGLDVHPHYERWGSYLRRRQDWDLPRVAVAVDSEGDRLAVQAALPRWVVNAWTQPGDLGISRHGFLDDAACLACLYLPDGPRKSEDQLVAEAIGLPSAVLEVRQLLYSSDPVGRDLLERIAAAQGTPLDPLLAFEGRPMRAFYTEAICGGIVLRLGGKTDSGAPQIAVPLAFQSTLAGIMLAAELVAQAGSLREGPIPTTTRVDVLRPIGDHLHVPVAKHPSGRCICSDADFVQCYQRKYGAQS